MTFDDHRKLCDQCNTQPYRLCKVGADLLIREEEWKPGDPTPLMTGGMTPRQIAALVARTVRDTRCDCGAELVVHREPGWDIDIVCPMRLGAPNRTEAEKHYRLPIDTGPFSLGRRVD